MASSSAASSSSESEESFDEVSSTESEQSEREENLTGPGTCKTQERSESSASRSLPKSKRFSTSTVGILNHYYKNGMCGVGRRYDGLIRCAAREAQLTVLQVKVCWIRYFMR